MHSRYHLGISTSVLSSGGAVNILRQASQATFHEEPVFIWIGGMCLQFYYRLASQSTNSLKATRRLEWCEREQKSGETVAVGQLFVYGLTIESVDQPFFTPLKGKASPHQSSSGQQVSPEDVCAKMHMVMAVESLWHCPKKTAEFFDLSRHNVLERAHQAGVKYDLTQTVAQQMLSQSLLVLHQRGGALSRRKRGRKIQV
jgi:hypothetical protein